jgi:hypothetical protein
MPICFSSPMNTLRRELGPAKPCASSPAGNNDNKITCYIVSMLRAVHSS